MRTRDTPARAALQQRMNATLARLKRCPLG